MIKSKKYIKVSEQFYSIQGEGPLTGVPSLWLRSFSCSLKCKGFSQPDPTNPETYIDKYSDLDAKKYKSILELPILKTGCDTYYSIDPRFKNLSPNMTNEEIITTWKSLLPEHDKTFKGLDLCFTGGEPLLWQNEIINLIYDVLAIGEIPNRIQFETNSTTHVNGNMVDLENHLKDAYSLENIGKNRIHFNISPKLYTVSGEKDAVNYDMIYNTVNKGFSTALKFVCNDTNECWDEMDSILDTLSKVHMGKDNVPIYIMPVGATYEQQNDTNYLSKVAKRILERKLNMSGRLHCIIFGNQQFT